MKKKNNPITEQAKQKSCNAPVMFKKSLVRYSSFFQASFRIVFNSFLKLIENMVTVVATAIVSAIGSAM